MTHDQLSKLDDDELFDIIREERLDFVKINGHGAIRELRERAARGFMARLRVYGLDRLPDPSRCRKSALSDRGYRDSDAVRAGMKMKEMGLVPGLEATANSLDTNVYYVAVIALVDSTGMVRRTYRLTQGGRLEVGRYSFTVLVAPSERGCEDPAAG